MNLKNIFFCLDVSERLNFRNHNVTLSYPVFLCLTSKSVYIGKEPVFRFSKEEILPSSQIDEYNKDSSVTNRIDGVLSNQLETDLFADYKVAMNKILLPHNPDQGWDYVEQQIFQIIGRVGKYFIEDIRHASISETCKNFVVCNFDVFIDAAMQPRIVDIEGSGILPNKTMMGDFVSIGLDGGKESFVRVD